MLQVQHVLVENALRERVTLRVDGGIKTGWEAWWQWLGLVGWVTLQNHQNRVGFWAMVPSKSMAYRGTSWASEGFVQVLARFFGDGNWM